MIFTVFIYIQVNHYRFSISWPRILPDGRSNSINEAGILYYNQLIDALIDANIEPIVTLYDFDLPLTLHNNGDWMNATHAYLFAAYADICFERFGDRVRGLLFGIFGIVLTHFDKYYCMILIDVWLLMGVCYPQRSSIPLSIFFPDLLNGAY